jgi:hypothetical protein
MSDLNTNFKISPVDDCCWMNDDCSIYIEADDAISAKAFVDYLDTLRQQNAELVELVRAAYDEGAEEGFYVGNCDFKASNAFEALSKIKGDKDA